MKKYFIRFERLKSAPLLLFCFSVFFCFCPPITPRVVAQELSDVLDTRSSIGLRLPELRTLDPRVFPFDKAPVRGLLVGGEASSFLDWQPFSLKRSTVIDSTGKFIIVSEEMNGLPLRLRYMVPLNTYLSERLLYEQKLAWHRAATENIYRLSDEQRRGPGGVNIEIPVPIKSRAFEQIFGGNTVGLNVQGDISIKITGRNEKRDEVQTAFNRGSSFSFKMQQQQRFTVTGRIGEKVQVNVDQDSERAFDFENNIRLNYTGFEDDIVQKIEAGNVALTLPGTRFVTFGGTSAGLFGIKTEMQIGNLALTAIASQEKGENKRLTLSGGTTEGSQKIQDYDYRRFTYFFLDSLYRDQFRRYSRQKWVPSFDPDRVIIDIFVYKAAPQYDTRPESIPGRVYPADTLKYAGEIETGNFIRLEPNVDYYIDKNRGYLVMTNPLSDDEVLGVAFRTPQETVGDVDYIADSERTRRKSIKLRLIKGKSPEPKKSTWDLEWKNVYYLGGRNIPREGFELKIFFKPPSGDPQEALRIGNDTKSYLEVFGLDVRDNNGAPRPDNIVDFDDVILNLGRGELIFPDLRPFDPTGVFVDGKPQTDHLLEDNNRAKFYDKSNVDRSGIDQASKYYIEVKSKTRSSNYSLGFNIIENSEKVLLNGVELQRDTDYIIDYFSGNLTILKEEASKPNANVEISYQGNSLFQLEKKSILGARAEYRFNPNSYLGGTVLYLSQRTLDQRIRLGSVDTGPMRNLIWDINGALKFQPNFLSQALNALPMLSTQESSELRFEGEIAQVLPNPNTLNSKVPGDKDGVAYVDDFEASKRSTPLGVIRRGWVQSSIPKEILDDPTNVAPPDALAARKERSALARRGKLIWYNPFSGVPTQQIYPDRDVNQTNQITQVLSLEFDPTANEADKTTPQGLKRAWGGIMRALSPGFFNQTESKFLEIWFFGSRGRVHVDLGQISEDAIPNGQLNTEDVFGGIRNNILDEGEDIGVDGIKGSDAATNFSNDGAGRDYWELTGDKQKNFGEPASDDDWSYASRSDDYNHINGTENSKNDANEAGGSIRPDTEDINANGGLDPANNYISYAFSIDTNNVAVKSRYFKGGRLSGWKLYRIPLSDGVKSDGSRNLTASDFSRIEYVRVWVDSVDDARGTYLSLADISLVGNEWKEVGVVKNETDFRGAQLDQRFEVTVINNEENPDDYESPPGVQGEVDRITFLRSKEQSLTLRVKTEGSGLRPNEIAVAQKTFFQPMNLINYSRLKMFVYGKQDLQRAGGAPLENGEFFIRFGADSSNFYEFREKVFAGWDQRNNMDIDLIRLASLKDTLDVLPPDSAVTGYKKDVFRYRRIRLGGGQELRVRGNPSLTNIRTLVTGIKNLDPAKNFWGEIWMDEMRVAEVKKDKGIALRARADLKLADFMTINGEINRQDADFHNVSQRFGGGDTRTSITLASSMTADKLLPQSLGLAVPVSMNYTATRATPKYVPGTDIETRALAETDELLKRSKSFNDQIGVNVSVRRRSRSQNFLVKNTLDNLAGSLSYTKSYLTNSQTDSSRRVAWAGDMSYNLTFGAKNYVEPFKWIGRAPLLGKLTNTKFYYTPQSVSAQLQATKNHDFSKSRLAGSRNGVVSNTDVYTAVTNFRGAMKLVENISLDYSYGLTSDLLSKNRPFRAFQDSLRMVRNGNLKPTQFDTTKTPPLQYKEGLRTLLNGNHEVVSISQSAGAKYSPNLFSWFNPNLSYNSNYRYGNNIQQGDIGRSAGTNTTLTASSTLRLGEMFKIFQRKDAPPGREKPDRKQRQAPRLPPGQPQPDEVNREENEEQRQPPSDHEERVTPPDEGGKEKGQKEKEDEKKKEDKPGRRISPLQVFSLFTKFKDISVNFSRNDSYFDGALLPGRPAWGYQFGFTRNVGLLSVDSITTPTSFQRRENISLSSGFDISRSFNITVRFDHDQQRSESTNKYRFRFNNMDSIRTTSTFTGSSSDSWLRTSELGLSFLPDVDIPFPEWSVRWSGLEKFKWFGKFATNLSVEHGFGGKRSTTWNGASDRITGEDFAFNFRPLIKVNSTLKNGMVATFQYTKTSGDRPTYTYDASRPPDARNVFQSSSLTRTNELSFTMTYSKQSGFKIPLPFLKNKELRNSVDFSATFLKSSSVSAQQRGSRKKEDEIEDNKTDRWSFSPRMTYSFSNRVRGGAHFETGVTKSKRTGDIKITELGIDINISIRGE